jgi:hypothetical protein
MTTISHELAHAVLHEQKYASKLERDFALVLAGWQAKGVIHLFRYEPFRLRLADGAFYKPDFMAVSTFDEAITLFEVKGHWREAAKVRIKVAAELHHYFKFCIVMRKKGVWQYDYM